MNRSPLTSFRGEVLPGIGHNQGPPLVAGHGFRVHAWKKARAELMPKLPLEILKRRVARSKELGLAYPQYASILLGTGRDVIAFLFTSDAIGLRLVRGADLPDGARAKLADLQNVDRYLMTPPDSDPVEIGRFLADTHQITFDGTGNAPAPPETPQNGRRAIRHLLDPKRLPGDAVVMIGTTFAERDWAFAARLAKFLPAEHYFE